MATRHNHQKLTTKVSFEVGGPQSPTSPPNSAGLSSLSSQEIGDHWNASCDLDDDDSDNGILSAAEKLKAEIKANRGSQSSLDSAMGALSLMSSHHSLASTGEMGTEPLESKVLIIYVGGTVGMKKNSQGVYVPWSNYMAKALKSMPMFYDVEMAKKLGLADDTFILPTTKENRRVFYWIHEYEQLKDSSNLHIDDWIQMAKDVFRFYRKYDGFVILHGTDTMAYSASALSFMLENLGKPVILTGAQVPLCELRSDGRDNLLGALYIAGHYVIPEVTLYFNNKLFRGNRCTKKSSESFNAFDSPNLPPLVKLHVNVEVDWGVVFRARNAEAFCVSLSMNDNVGVLRIFPGINTATIRAFMSPPMQGVVLQTFGAGNGPTCRDDFIAVIKEASNRGVLIVNITQCTQGMVSPGYSTGKILMDAGVILGSDMTPEAALAKLSYVLGKEGLSHQDRRQLLNTNLRGEMKVPEINDSNLTLLDNKFVRAVADTLRLTSVQEVKAVGNALFPPMMCAAAANGDLTGLKHLQNCGGNLSAGDYDGRTPLHLAACTGDVDMVKYLLDNGCPVYERDRFGNTPFTESIRCKHLEVIGQIRKAGGHLIHETQEEIGSMICAAVYIDDKDKLEAFFVAGVDLSTADYRGNTALHLSAADKRLECLQYLATHTENLDKKDFNGFTALQLAESKGHLEAVKILREAQGLWKSSKTNGINGKASEDTSVLNGKTGKDAT